MRNKTKFFLLAFAFSIGFFSIQSCKERTTTPAGMIPIVDGIHTFELTADSLGIALHLGQFDSTTTDQRGTGLNPMIGLGSIANDPFFGSLNQSLYLQLTVPNPRLFFPDSLILDSAFIALPYAGYSYGDTTFPASNFQSFKVFRITDAQRFRDSLQVYTFQDIPINPTQIGGGTYSLKSMTDSFALGADTLSNQLRIKLDKNYVQTNFVQADTSNYHDVGSGRDYIKGFYILPKDEMGSKRISYFNLGGSDPLQSARMDLYFHTQSGGKVQTVSFPFRDIASTGYLNHISRNPTGHPIQQYLNHPNQLDSFLMMGYPGYYTEFTLHNLDKIPASVINQAKITLTTQALNDPISWLGFPPTLLLETVDENGKSGPIADVLSLNGDPSNGGFSFMDGVVDEITKNGLHYQQWTLNFPRELQKTLMAGKDSLKLRVSVTSPYRGAFRLVAPGFNGADTSTQARVSIIYTKLD